MRYFVTGRFADRPATTYEVEASSAAAARRVATAAGITVTAVTPDGAEHPADNPDEVNLAERVQHERGRHADRRRSRQWAVFLAVGLGIAIAVGWAARTVFRDAIPPDPDEVVLISVDGTQMSREPGDRMFPPGAEMLYECAVLGRVAVTDPDQRRAVLAAVNADIRAGYPHPNTCLKFRHVLRVLRAGVVTDYAICFECHNFVVYHDGKRRPGLTPSIGDTSRPLLNDLLTSAGVPIAP